MSNVDNIKQFCKLLSAYNVVQVIGSYDGSGDSGDMNLMLVILDTPEQTDKRMHQTSNPTNIFGQTKRMGFRAWRQEITNKTHNKAQKPLVTNEQCDEFEDDVFSFLPGGWEINDGSFGSITIDTATEKISVKHNERYVEIRTESREY